MSYVSGRVVDPQWVGELALRSRLSANFLDQILSERKDANGPSLVHPNSLLYLIGTREEFKALSIRARRNEACLTSRNDFLPSVDAGRKRLCDGIGREPRSQVSEGSTVVDNTTALNTKDFYYGNVVSNKTAFYGNQFNKISMHETDPWNEISTSVSAPRAVVLPEALNSYLGRTRQDKRAAKGWHRAQSRVVRRKERSLLKGQEALVQFSLSSQGDFTELGGTQVGIPREMRVSDEGNNPSKHAFPDKKIYCGGIVHMMNQTELEGQSEVTILGADVPADVLVVPFLVENNKLEFNHQVDISITKGAKPRIRLEMRIRVLARYPYHRGRSETSCRVAFRSCPCRDSAFQLLAPIGTVAYRSSNGDVYKGSSQTEFLSRVAEAELEELVLSTLAAFFAIASVEWLRGELKLLRLSAMEMVLHTEDLSPCSTKEMNEWKAAGGIPNCHAGFLYQHSLQAESKTDLKTEWKTHETARTISRLGNDTTGKKKKAAYHLRALKGRFQKSQDHAEKVEKPQSQVNFESWKEDARVAKEELTALNRLL
ncbi:hypothetical protein VNO77_37831 [Canavalia gladiata]|uniref:Uncharacterized protein n=1 Tax=Canavalia gladiata TaxID=3824 RepID=A0AAN9KB69_CANGL